MKQHLLIVLKNGLGATVFTGHCNDHMKPFDQHDPILPQDTGWHDINLQHNYSVGQGTFALKHYDYKVPEQLRVIDTMYVTICWDLISQGGDHDHCTGEKLGPNIFVHKLARTARAI